MFTSKDKEKEQIKKWKFKIIEKISNALVKCLITISAKDRNIFIHKMFEECKKESNEACSAEVNALDNSKVSAYYIKKILLKIINPNSNETCEEG